MRAGYREMTKHAERPFTLRLARRDLKKVSLTDTVCRSRGLTHSYGGHL
jgi:hypothetical protein